MYNILQKYFSSLVFLTKILIIAGAYYVVSDRLLNDGNFNGILWLERIDSMGGSSLTIIILLFFFTLMNWSLEIFKWKTLVSSVAKISFTEAAKQSLASLTASLLTPNRIGEYGAKAIYFKKNYRPKILVLNFLGNAYQMFITLVFGLIGLSLIGDQFSLNSVSVSFLIGIMISFILFISLIVLLRKKWLDYLLKISNDLFKIPFQIHKRVLYMLLEDTWSFLISSIYF